MTDIIFTIKWFLAFFIIGSIFLPITFTLFKNFKDKGYIFSKIISMALISYFVYILGFLNIFKFTQVNIIIVLIIALIINYLLSKKIEFVKIIKISFKIFILEELIFLLTLFAWVFVRGNLPEIHGLEKYMDFGFVNSILRSDYFPPKDMWYTNFPINYYYFGHLITAVLIKFTSIPSYIGYNLMIAVLFAFTFTASFSLGINIFDNLRFSLKSFLAGLISSILVSLGGNLTTIYTFFKAYPNDNPIAFWKLEFLPFSFPNNYWYPNATRFIPYTIHEFPLYSFVVSDLHGHVIDIPLVLLTLAICFSLILKNTLSILNLILLSFIFSIMYMTNAWDGLIYLLLGFIIVFVINFRLQNKWVITKNNFYLAVRNISILIIGFFTFSLPFNINFKPFVSGIGILCAPEFLTKIAKIGPFVFEANHCQKSPIWQLSLLYGFFYFFVICFLLFLKFKKNYKINQREIFVLILFFLSTLLIIVPEFIYIKDIYPMHYRANTMFKLAYEAFIMFSLSMGIVIVILISKIRNKLMKLSMFIISVLLLSLVLIYPVFAINSYYRDLKTYQSLNGINYLLTLHPGDYALINWINKYILDQPVILEAVGESYTDYARISANTGLPTVVGWPVHEWLWRGTYDIVAPRISDVETIYTSSDLDYIKQLLKKYNVKFVVVSDLEREKYSSLNEQNFTKVGKLIFQNKQTKLYQITY